MLRCRGFMSHIAIYQAHLLLYFNGRYMIIYYCFKVASTSSSSVASNDGATGFHPRANPLLDTLLELVALKEGNRHYRQEMNVEVRARVS